MKSETTKDNLLLKWKNREKKENPSNVIPKAPKGVPIPLSNGQKALWFLQDLNKESSFYNYGEAYDLIGDWSIIDLKKSLLHIYESSDILRTSCFSSASGLELKVAEVASLKLNEFDFSDLGNEEATNRAKRVISTDFTTPFDLSHPPLLRVSLIKLDESKYVLCLSMHHIITDEWSVDIIIRRLSEYYTKLRNKVALPEHNQELQFSDFAFWDSTRTLPDKELRYWKAKLSGTIPVLQLQTDYKRPTQPSYEGGYKTVEFSERLSASLLQLAQKLEVTPFVLLLSIFYVLLYRHTDQTDIFIGSPIAKRNHTGLEDLLGFFLDTLILRNEIQGEKSFLEIVSSVNKNTLEAFSNKDIPFDVLVKELNPERSAMLNPFFQVMFVYNTEFEEPNFGKDLIFKKNDLIKLGTSKFDLTLFVSKKEGVLSASFEYATDLFEEVTIDRLLAHLELLAQGVVTDNRSIIAELPMHTEEESVLFSEISQPPILGPFSKTSFGIHGLFDACVLRSPEAQAISFGAISMSYGQVNDKANDIALNLLKFTGGENVLVGLCIDRSLEMIIGLLAILKSGSAYVPLDPEYPQERIKYIVEDSKATLVLTEQKYCANFDALHIKNVSISDEKMTQRPADSVFPEIAPESIAYVIYTSGSTGQPKGVPISHQNIISSTAARFRLYNDNPSAFLLLSSISFDSSKAGIFWTLCSGGNLIIAPKRLEQDMVAMEETIVTHRISHLLTLPTLYSLMLDHIKSGVLEHLKTVIVAGETCPVQLPEKHFKTLKSTRLFNEYGPTEATVWSTAYQLTASNPYKSISIGKAIEGINIHVLNSKLKHVPYGAVGELYISGAGLSKGYLGQPELTKSKFVENPFVSGTTNVRMYRSGDLARYRPDGNIEFLGRADSQIKLRGFRIELDEVENTLRTHPEIKEAAVLISTPEEQSSHGSGILLAYIVSNSATDTKEVKGYLKSMLPKHMVPSKIIRLDDFRRLPNGKVDKKYLEHLPILATEEPNTAKAEATETERSLIAIWEKILGFGGLGVNDNFFEIGGDSIMTIQVIAEARKMGMAISPNQLFEYQTVGELALFVDQNQQKEDRWDYIVPLRKAGTKKPLFCIHAGGGHVFFYNKLTDHLNLEVPIYALQPSGVYGDKGMHTSVREMAEAYLDAIRKVQPQGPYNILVYCFSVAVGNQMALLLQEMDEEINLIVMDTMTAPAVLNTPRRLKIRILTFLIRFFKAPIRSLNTMVRSKYALVRLKWRSNFEVDEEAKELEKLRVNLMHLSQTYQWKPFNGTTSLLLTQKDHEALNKETIRSWKEIANEEVTIIETPGSHKDLFDEPYVQDTAESIEKCMLD